MKYFLSDFESDFENLHERNMSRFIKDQNKDCRTILKKLKVSTVTVARRMYTIRTFYILKKKLQHVSSLVIVAVDTEANEPSKVL